MYLLLIPYMLGTPQLYPFRHWAFKDEVTDILLFPCGAYSRARGDGNKKIYNVLRAGEEG